MKVLIISHNPVSTYNGMGRTINTFFSEFEKDELIQLYIYPSLPDVDTCKSYYRITDKDVLKSYLKFGRCNGCVISGNINYDSLVFENENDEKIYSNKNNKKPLRILLRDLMWKCSGWYNRILTRWLDAEQPECIFLAPGGAKFIYDMALKISEKLSIPIVTYIADEYYFVNPEKAFLGKLQHKLIKKKMDVILKKSAHIITISKEFENLYKKQFTDSVSTIMTGSEVAVRSEVSVKQTVKTVSYFGNLAYNRYLSLGEIGRALERINLLHNTNIELHIYSAQNNESALELFKTIPSIRFKGFISGEEYEQKFSNAELLIHTESFDDVNIDLVKHSVSTKIADTLASGIPLFAYGPECVSSMKHLDSNNCAFIAYSKHELVEVLEKALFNDDLRREVALNALETAALFHDKTRNSKELRKIITSNRGIDE